MSSEIIHSVVLGIVQGLGEFLPISSTAHLILVPYFFNWPDPGLAFDVALHFGTFLAVIAFFWRDWIIILKLAFQNKIKSETLPTGRQELKVKSYGRNTLWLLVIATIPGALVGYLLDNWAETTFRQPLLIALVLALFGLVLYLSDKFYPIKKSMDKINFRDSLLIGLSQAFAIIPGVSRSGATITASRLLKFDRESAARFSFLLSTPIIFGAFIFKAHELVKNLANPSVILSIIVSAVSGYLAIKYLLKFVQKHDLKIFFWYRLALAAVILIFFFFK